VRRAVAILDRGDNRARPGKLVIHSLFTLSQFSTGHGAPRSNL
jgi:hypothetical protein